MVGSTPRSTSVDSCINGLTPHGLANLPLAPTFSDQQQQHPHSNNPVAVLQRSSSSSVPHGSHLSAERHSDAVFQVLLASMRQAQRLIIQQYGTLTTLVVSVVMKAKWLSKPGQWVLHTLSVGDSAAYVYRAADGSVEEVTAGSHTDLMR